MRLWTPAAVSSHLSGLALEATRSSLVPGRRQLVRLIAASFGSRGQSGSDGIGVFFVLLVRTVEWSGEHIGDEVSCLLQ